MSNHFRITKHPETGEFEQAVWMDNFYAARRWGVRFPDGKTYREEEHTWEFQDMPVKKQE